MESCSQKGKNVQNRTLPRRVTIIIPLLTLLKNYNVNSISHKHYLFSYYQHKLIDKIHYLYEWHRVITVMDITVSVCRKFLKQFLVNGFHY